MERVWTVKRLATGKSTSARQNELFQEAARNISNFVPLEKISFEARKIEILSPEKMSVIVPGKKRRIEGFSLVSQNISNPMPLGITIQRGILKQDPIRPNRLFIRGDGLIAINGGKATVLPEQPKVNLRRLVPAKYPDLTSVDGTEFVKTNFQIQIRLGALIILS